MDKDGLLSQALRGSLGNESQDDFVEYKIYVDKVESRRSRKDLENLALELKVFATQICKGYVWHKEAFNAVPVIPKSTVEEGYVYGHVVVGSSMIDEWAVIMILREFSALHHNITITISDADGQVLLIEAASTIPDWLSPDNSDNRVFVKSGKLHLVSEAKELDVGLDLETGLSKVRDSEGNTCCNDTTQSELWNRIRGYPKKLIEESMHTIKLKLPEVLINEILDDCQVVEKFCQAYVQEADGFIDGKPTNTIVALVRDTSKTIATSTWKPIHVRVSRLMYAHVQSVELPNSSELRSALNDLVGIGRVSEETNSRKVLFVQKLLMGYGIFMKNKLSLGNETEEDVSNLKVVSDVQAKRYLRRQLHQRKPFITCNSMNDYYEWLGCDRDSKGDMEDWLELNPTTVDEMLSNKYCDSELATGDLEQLVGDLHKFVDNNDTGIKGAEFAFPTGSEVSCDFEKLMAILRGDLDNELLDSLSDVDEIENSKFLQDHFGNDECDDAFDSSLTMKEVQLAMDNELQNSTLAKSFEQLSVDAKQDRHVNSEEQNRQVNNEGQDRQVNNEDNSNASRPMQVGDEESEGTYTNNAEQESCGEIDLDFNLVKSLLESHSSQGMESGPVGNLLGELGIDFNSK